nr:hypothetical protein [Tanacetum cinerariifolium]
MPVHIIVKNTRTIDMTIDQQVALDEAILPHASRLRIKKSNFRLKSNISSKESTLQLTYDVLRLTPFYKRNIDFSYLLWEYFIYQVEHKDAKKSNEMYYPSAMLPIELTNKDIRNSEAYKEYYVVATGAAPSKTKASVRKTKSSFDTTVTPSTAAAGSRLSTFTKGKQPAKASKAKSLTVLFEVAMTEAEQLKLAMKKSLQQTHISQASGSGVDEGTGIIPWVSDVPTEESDEKISWKSSDEEDDDDVDEGSADQEDDDAQNDDDDQ